MKNLSLKTKMAFVVSSIFLFLFASGSIWYQYEFEGHLKKIIADQQLKKATEVNSILQNQMSITQQASQGKEVIHQIDDEQEDNRKILFIAGVVASLIIGGVIIIGINNSHSPKSV